MGKPFLMLVDDEVSFIETMAKRLQKRELEVILATSGEEALKHLARHRNLDVIVVDVKMPGMNGLAVLKEVKKQFPLIEVIMLTGHGTIESAIEGMKAGAFDYLMKPCEIEQLVAKVEDAAGRKRNHEEKIEKARLEKVVSA